MGANEEAALRILGEYRGISDDLIAGHDGRIFNTAGDSVLAEFDSAVEAVRCAMSCQDEIAGRNDGKADDQKLIFRIHPRKLKPDALLFAFADAAHRAVQNERPALTRQIKG